MEEHKPDRPLGVAIISVLDIILGVIALLGGIVIVAMGPFMMTALSEAPLPFTGFMAGLLSILGIVIIVVGLISIILGYLLWNGSNIARLLHIVFAIISILLAVVSFNPSSIIGIVIDIIIIWYLTRPHVVAFFTYSE